MKILVLQDYLRSGGTERQSVLLAQGFARAGHATTLLTFRPGGPLQPTALIPRFSCASLQRIDPKLDWWAPGLIRRARALTPDIIICMGRMANCYGRSLQSNLPATAVISTLRTGKLLPRLFIKSLQTTRHVIANSHAARDQAYQRHAIAPERISVIHNALVFPQATSQPETRAQTRAQFGATADTLVLLDVAMFRPEKNQIALVDIASRLPPDLPWQLWLAGNGPALETCRARAASLGLTSRIHFPGWLENPRPLYAAADIAVHASHRESLSNFLIEAQSHGLPAIAYDALGVSETFIPGATGILIPTDDSDRFQAAILRLAHDPDLRSRMSARARTHALDNFSTASQIKAYLDLFFQLISSNSKP